MNMSSVVKPALLLLAIFTALTGFVYPLAITGIGQIVFPAKANGSLIEMNGKIVGSSQIGQHFSSDKYFWSRPSATAAFPYDASSSLGSNAGPINPALLEAISARTSSLAATPGSASGKPAVDLIAASASGLDPHISPEAALSQLERVARARNLAPERVRRSIEDHTEGRTFGVFGEPRVNVLLLNLALDREAR
jgi:K+-transporting ATPase ATPase C chain